MDPVFGRGRMLLRAVLFTALVSLCAKGARPDMVLNRGNIAEPGTLDPQKYSTTYDHAIAIDLFEGLLTVGPDGRPIPGGAESYTVSPDGKVFTFKIRDGLKWSDGRPMTADD